ncbi:MAG TPA: hypothetical protein PK090_06800 [Smithellaceae bacterium]|nr:hypothetical protein [Smithellaceae bacterium]
MKKTIIQIYEIQKPKEAEALAAAGVDHIGSVLLDTDKRKNAAIRKTVLAARQAGAKSGVIPLFNDPARIFAALEYYEPDFVHLCDTLAPYPDRRKAVVRDFDAFLSLQIDIKDRFPRIEIMRSLSVPRPGRPDRQEVEKILLDFAERFSPFSDYFLLDTLLDGDAQPVDGFVGVTGETCDWEMAKSVIEKSRIPVILAGGLSPENVFEAITAVRPAGVDSCTKTNAVDPSGQPVRFKKDMKRVEKFIAEVRRGDAFFSGVAS